MPPDDLQNPVDLLSYLMPDQLDDTFPNLCISLWVLLTLPVSVDAGERSFSKLKLRKTYLRSTTSLERLVGLAMLSIELDLLEKIDIEDVIKKVCWFKIKKNIYLILKYFYAQVIVCTDNCVTKSS